MYNSIYEDLKIFCKSVDLPFYELTPCNARLSTEVINETSASLYIDFSSNPMLKIKLDNDPPKKLRKLMKNQVKNLGIHKKKFITFPLVSKTVPDLLKEISEKSFNFFSFVSSIDAGNSRSSFSIVGFSLTTLRDIIDENPQIYLNESLYSEYFVKPDVWLFNFMLEINSGYLDSKKITAYIEIPSTRQIRQYKTIEESDYDIPFQEALSKLNLNFNRTMLIDKEFYLLFCSEQSMWNDFYLEFVEKTKERLTFYVKRGNENASVYYHDNQNFEEFLKDAYDSSRFVYNSMKACSED